MTPPLSERLSAACTEVELVRHLLLSPTPQLLDQCAERLAAAVALLTVCRDAARQTSPSERLLWKDPLRRLLHSLSHVRILLESAATFHSGWIQLLSGWCAGYTGKGTPGSLDHPPRLYARG